MVIQADRARIGPTRRGETLEDTIDESSYILVIDDDESICELIAEILSEEGYEVTRDARRSRALKMIEQRPPALILLDLSVADQSAEELVAAIRRLPGQSIVDHRRQRAHRRRAAGRGGRRRWVSAEAVRPADPARHGAGDPLGAHGSGAQLTRGSRAAIDGRARDAGRAMVGAPSPRSPDPAGARPCRSPAC